MKYTRDEIRRKSCSE